LVESDPLEKVARVNNDPNVFPGKYMIEVEAIKVLQKESTRTGKTISKYLRIENSTAILHQVKWRINRIIISLGILASLRLLGLFIDLRQFNFHLRIDPLIRNP